MILRNLLLAAVALGACLVFAGCGEDTAELEDAIAELEAATGGGEEKTKPAGPPETAPALVRRYFELIDEDEFTEAWSLLAPGVQEEFGGFESWRDGYSTNTSTKVVEAEVTSTAGEEDDLTVRIEAVDTCGEDRYAQEFEGNWSVDVARAKVTEAAFAPVSGEPPPDDCG